MNEKDYGEDSRDETPIRKVLNLSREPYYSAVGKRFNTLNNDKNLKPKNIRNLTRKNYKNQYNDGDDDDYYDNPQNYYNPEESQNDYELSSINGEDRMPQNMRISRSPEPVRLKNKSTRVIQKPRYQEGRTKDIQAMPRLRKQPITNYNVTNEDDVDDLIKTIEDLQAIPC